MSIGIDGQYYLQFKIGSNEDFLDSKDFYLFNVYEHAGNVLPTFEWSFRTRDDTILSKMNEGNIIQAQFGRSRSDLQDAKLTISSISPTKEGADFTRIDCTGYAGEINYITDHHLQITPKQSAVQTIMDVASSNGMTVVSNVTTSFDSQNWIQHNMTDKAFVQQCYLRANVGDSALAIAITSDNKLIIKDLVKDFRRPFFPRYDWKFTRRTPILDTDIVYDSSGNFASKAGFINNWLGYGRQIKEINNLTSSVTDILYQPEVVLALSDQVDKNQSIDIRYGGNKFISDSVDSNFNYSYNHNLQFLANLSKIENIVSITDNFFNILPLDLVMYTEESSVNNQESSNTKSGLFVCSTVVKNFQARRFNMTVTLNRESLNEVVNAG